MNKFAVICCRTCGFGVHMICDNAIEIPTFIVRMTRWSCTLLCPRSPHSPGYHPLSDIPVVNKNWPIYGTWALHSFGKKLYSGLPHVWTQWRQQKVEMFPFPSALQRHLNRAPRGGLGSTHLLIWLAILSNKGHFSIGSWHGFLPESCVSTGRSLKCPLHVWTDNGPANGSAVTPCGLLFKAVKKRMGGAGEVLNGTMGHLSHQRDQVDG